MESTTIKIQTDSEVIKQAEELFAELGLTMTAAINIFLNQTVQKKTIPFEFMNENSQLDDKSDNSPTITDENTDHNLLDLFGEIQFADGYDYKSLR